MALQLSAALVACDRNPDYLEFWPLVREAWSRVVGVPAYLVLVADDVPAHLAIDPFVIHFAPIPHISTVLQAQVIRLVAPCALPTPDNGAVVIADMDMIPLSGRYFRAPLAWIPENAFVAYRSQTQLPMCYNAARRATWAEIFFQDQRQHAKIAWPEVRERLADLTTEVGFADEHGGKGWFTDQELLTTSVTEWGTRTGRLRVLDDRDTGFARVDRKWGAARIATLPLHVQLGIAGARYSDYHMLLPASANETANRAVLDRALASGPIARLARSRIGALTAPGNLATLRRILRPGR